MTIYELQRRKAELGYSDELIAVLSGVALETIEALFSDRPVSAITYEDRMAVENLLKEPNENIHQDFVAELIYEIKHYIKKNNGKCRAFPSPDVQLDCDDRTMVTPDVVVHNWLSEEVTQIYRFEDQIPVGIFEGKCEVDFAQIYGEIASLFEK